MKFKFHTLYFILFAPFTPVFSQEGVDRDFREIVFRVFPIGDTNWDGIFFQAEPGVFREIRFASFSRSIHSYKQKGGDQLAFYRKIPIEERTPDGPVYRQVGSISIPASNLEPLVFFVPESHRSLVERDQAGDWTNREFELLVIDDSPNSFPMDHIVFLNATGTELAGLLGEEKVLFTLGPSKPYDLGDFREDGVFMGLVVRRDNDSVKVVHKDHWNYSPGNRFILIFLPPARPDSYRVRAYSIAQYVEELEGF